jgi:hypothetical protein
VRDKFLLSIVFDSIKNQSGISKAVPNERDWFEAMLFKTKCVDFAEKQGVRLQECIANGFLINRKIAAITPLKWGFLDEILRERAAYSNSELNYLGIFNNYYIVHYEDGWTASENESYKMAHCTCREWRHPGRCRHTLALHLIYRNSFSTQDCNVMPTQKRFEQMARTENLSEYSIASCLSLEENIQEEGDAASECGLRRNYRFRFFEIKSSQPATFKHPPQWVKDKKESAKLNESPALFPNTQTNLDYLQEPNRILNKSIRRLKREEIAVLHAIELQYAEDSEIFGSEIETDPAYSYEHSGVPLDLINSEVQDIEDSVTENISASINDP